MIKCDLKSGDVKCGCQSTTFKWINYEKKAIFFEIPKNGSTSLKQLLKSNGFQLLTEDVEYDEFYTFTFIRNPYDRLISNWKMFCGGSGKWMSEKQLNFLFKEDPKNMTLTEFAEIIQTVNNHHWDQQTEYLKDSKGKIIYLDFYARFENFYREFKVIKNKLNLTGALLNINKTDHTQYQTYFIQYRKIDLLKIINEKYKDDFKEFNYKF